MATKPTKPVPLTEDEATLWLTQAMIEEATVMDGTLILTRDDGAVLRVSAMDHPSTITAHTKGNALPPVLDFSAEGSTA